MDGAHHAWSMHIADKIHADLLMIASRIETENGGGGLPNPLVDLRLSLRVGPLLCLLWEI